MNNKLGLVLRIVLVLFAGATTVMTLLGAVGTACLAWNGDKYPKAAFGWIVPLMPTFQTLVYLSLAAGVALAIVTYAIARGDKWFYLGGLIFLVMAGGAAAYQMYLSSSSRNISFFAAAPTNIRLYITAATLIAFLIIRFPGIWNKSGLDKPGNSKPDFTTPSGLALMLCGAMLVTAPLWASPEHVVDGVNYVMTLIVPLVLDGVGLLVTGAGILFAPRLIALAQHKRALAQE